MPKSFYEVGVRERGRAGEGTGAVWVLGHGRVRAWRESSQTLARLTLCTGLLSVFFSMKCLETVLTDIGQVASYVDL